jgi:hypothetical protein
VFRASSICDNGPDLHRSRPGPRQLGRSFAAGSPPRHILQEELRHTRITWPGSTSAVRVKTVESETTSTRAANITLTAERTAENRSNLVEMGMEGRTPDDLTELAARVVLLGEPNPLEAMSFMMNGTNPLPALEAVRPAARGLGGIGWGAAGHRTARRRARCRPHHFIPFGTQAVGPAPAPPGVDAPQAVHQRGASRAVHRRRNASAEHPLEQASGLRPALQMTDLHRVCQPLSSSLCCQIFVGCLMNAEWRASRQPVDNQKDTLYLHLCWSGRGDLNPRPQRPEG